MSDLISREKLLDVIKPMVGMWDDGTFWINYEIVLDIIESADPEERIAKVEILEMRNTHNKVWKCSNCGQYMHRANWAREVKYCSHCGCRLEWDE